MCQDRHTAGPVSIGREISCPSAGTNLSAYREIGMSACTEQDIAKKFGARIVDSRKWFCTQSGFCPAFVGTTPVYVDSGHMTATYSESLAPDLREALVA